MERPFAGHAGLNGVRWSRPFKGQKKGGGGVEIGSKLKIARKCVGLTQEQAAEALGVSRQTISNWENNKTYPDILSVIRMSDLYSISLDHLLKEETAMHPTYQDFLEESTNTVRAGRRVEKAIVLSTYVVVWAIATAAFWLVRGPATAGCGVAFRWILLPLVLLGATFTIARRDYWGRGDWLAVPAAAITFLTVPYTRFAQAAEEGTFTFVLPNVGYMAVGIALAVCGLCAGRMWRRMRRRLPSGSGEEANG